MPISIATCTVLADRMVLMNSLCFCRQFDFGGGTSCNGKYSPSRKHAYIIMTPLNPYFYIVKLGFTGVYIIFLISAQKHRLWVLSRTASLRRFYQVPTIYVLSRNMKYIRDFYLKIFSFWR